jgi:2-haloacid dehalogenase
MPDLLAFDVNETLLDLSALDAPFAAVFGDATLRPVWFQTMLQLSFVGGLTGEYIDFTSAQHAALEMLAGRARVALTDAQAESIVGTMRRLPAHADAPPALQRLRDAGFRRITLTNSPLSVVRDQLEFAGLAAYFEATISADEVRQLKPAPVPYQLVATRTGVDIASVRLIAAHGWDISGALAAGAKAAFVARPGAMLNRAGRQPDFTGRDLGEIADKLIAMNDGTPP